MATTPFVGREAELATLSEAAARAADNHGGIVLVEGAMGLGKGALLEALVRHVTSDLQTPRRRAAIGYCYEGSADSAYYPFVEALSQLTAEGPRRSVSKLTLDLIRQVGPDLLRVIPVLGDAAAAGLKAVSVTGDWWLGAAPSNSLGVSRNIPLQFADTILALSQTQGPLLLVIEDMHWADAASAELLLRLSHRVGDHPILIVGSYRREEAPDGAFAHSRRELVGSGGATELALMPFSREEVARLIGQSYGSDVEHALASWLFELSGGHPLFAASYLGLLEKRGALRPSPDTGVWRLEGDVAGLPVPDDVVAILEARLARLKSVERRVLQSSSVQGQRFHAVVSAQSVEMDEMAVVELLQEVSRREDLVTYYEADRWTAEWTDSFSFSDQLVQRTLYAGLTERQKTLLHRAAGRLLQDRLSAGGPHPIHALIETADHLAQGKLWAEASPLLLDAAKLSYANAASDDTARLCDRALATLAELDQSTMTTQLRAVRAQCIQLLLLSSELRWWGAPLRTAVGQSPLELLDQADDDATAAGDLPLRAQLTFLRARVTVVGESLPAALALYEEAARQAKEAGDGLGEVVTLTEWGHHLVGVDPERGLATLKDAYEKWKVLAPALESTAPAPVLARHLHRLQGSIGLAEFDRGEFDLAERELRAAYDGLRHRRMPDLESLVSNFLAQLYTAEGRFEEAENVLLEAIGTLKDEDDALAHRGYNLSLLGKLYLEWERPDDAAEPLTRAFETTRATSNESALPIIRNYYSELLCCATSSSRDESLAEQLLTETIAAATRSGNARSVVAAQTTLAQLLLRLDRAPEALSASDAAVTTLDQHGWLPATRSEEVLFTHARTLQANQFDAQAHQFLLRAADVVHRKSESIAQESRRDQFLTRVPVNHAINDMLTTTSRS